MLLTEATKRAVVVNGEMRKRGDAELIMRLEAFFVVVTICEILFVKCDFVTKLGVCVFHLTLVL